jgi:Family of unknown function (DUF5343)
MADAEAKKPVPAYVPFKTFSNFTNGLRENGIPSRVDRSAMRGLSGGAQSAIKAAFEFLGLITSTEEPTEKLHQLVESSDKDRPAVLAKILREAYPFLFGGSIDLTRATTKQVEEVFRAQNISGSTVVKSMAFFLACAKEARLPVSPYIKTPSLPPRPAQPKRQASTAAESRNDSREYDEDSARNLDIPEGMQRIELPLINKPNVILALPADFDSDDWVFLQPILEAYIRRALKDKEGGS